MKLTTRIAISSFFILQTFFIDTTAFAQTTCNCLVMPDLRVDGQTHFNTTAPIRIKDNAGVDGGRFYIATNGNVGIGTNTPTSKLQIKSGNVSLENGELFVTGSSPIGSSTIALRNEVSQTGVYSGMLTTISNNKLILGANGTRTMYFGTDDRVGIGTASALQKLHLKDGNALVENNNVQVMMGSSMYGTAGNTQYRGWIGTISSTSFGVGAYGQNTMVFDTDGEVGIGTSSPTSKLHVNGNVRVDANYSQAPGTFQIDETSIPGGRFSITSTGNVGIGKSNPTSKLHVNGNVRIENFNNNEWTETAYSQSPGTFQIDEPGVYGGRFSITTNGNVGIGKAVPSARLHVSGGNILMENNNIKLSVRDDYESGSGWIGTASNNPLTLIANNSAAMTIKTNGQVGIGTSEIESGSKLKVWGGSIVMEKLAAGEDEPIRVSINTNSTHTAGWIGTSTSDDLILGTGGQGRIHIGTDGNIFMGFSETAIPAPSSTVASNYDLFVHKGVLSEDFALAPVTEWADYVFHKNYKLKPLSEVEKFIHANQHLPGIPSAEEVRKDGYSVKDINVKFLEKIEELTLYTIDQQKEIQALKKQLQQYEQLAAEVEKLKQIISQK